MDRKEIKWKVWITVQNKTTVRMYKCAFFHVVTRIYIFDYEIIFFLNYFFKFDVELLNLLKMKKTKTNLVQQVYLRQTCTSIDFVHIHSWINQVNCCTMPRRMYKQKWEVGRLHSVRLCFSCVEISKSFFILR